MTLTTRRSLLVLLLIPTALAAEQAAPRSAVALEGQVFQGSVRVVGEELVLNGIGLRAVAWFKGYAAALYLPHRASAAAQAVAMPGPKRLELRLLQEVSATEFVRGFKKGVARNTVPSELPALAARMQRFGAAMASVGAVKKGDVVDLDFVPGRGLVFTVNGRQHGDAIEGEDFYRALLRSFVGERPYDVDLRARLLGAAPAGGRAP